LTAYRDLYLDSTRLSNKWHSNHASNRSIRFIEWNSQISLVL